MNRNPTTTMNHIEFPPAPQLTPTQQANLVDLVVMPEADVLNAFQKFDRLTKRLHILTSTEPPIFSAEEQCQRFLMFYLSFLKSHSPNGPTKTGETFKAFLNEADSNPISLLVRVQWL